MAGAVYSTYIPSTTITEYSRTYVCVHVDYLYSIVVDLTQAASTSHASSEHGTHNPSAWDNRPLVDIFRVDNSCLREKCNNIENISWKEYANIQAKLSKIPSMKTGIE